MKKSTKKIKEKVENNIKIYNDIIQGSPEWFVLRDLKLTASKAQAIGNCGKGLETLVDTLLAEHYSSADKIHFTSKDTERGNELEPIAREIYELETGNNVTKVGFVELNEYIGCSPDGLIDEEGGWECKSPDDLNHFRMIKNGFSEVDKAYLWQVQMNLLITNRKWWDLSFYNPNFKKNLITFRIEPDTKMFESLKEGLKIGVELIKNNLNLE